MGGEKGQIYKSQKPILIMKKVNKNEVKDTLKRFTMFKLSSLAIFIILLIVLKKNNTELWKENTLLMIVIVVAFIILFRFLYKKFK